jgi:hypothetical protein
MLVCMYGPNALSAKGRCMCTVADLFPTHPPMTPRWALGVGLRMEAPRRGDARWSARCTPTLGPSGPTEVVQAVSRREVWASSRVVCRLIVGMGPMGMGPFSHAPLAPSVLCTLWAWAPRVWAHPPMRRWHSVYCALCTVCCWEMQVSCMTLPYGTLCGTRGRGADLHAA